MKKDKKTKESLNQAQVLTSSCPSPQQENFTVSFLLQILNGTEDPIFVKDRQHRWVLLNEALAKFIGHEPAELIGKSDYDFLPQAEADVFWEKDELVFTTGITNENEESFTDAQGGTRFISTKKSLFTDDTGNQFLIGIIRDITQTKLIETELEKRVAERTLELQAEIIERQQKEAKLRAYEQRLALLIQQTPVGVVEWNTKFEIQEWNPAAEKIFGYSRSEVLGRHFAFLVPEIAKKHVNQVMDTLLYSQGEIVSVNENVTKDHRTIICEWYNNPLIADNGEVISIAAMVLDITERKQAEQNLVLYQQAVESSSDAIAIADAEGNHIYQNSAFCKLYECETVEDFIKLGGVHAVITNSEVAHEMWQTILGGKPWMGEVEQQSASGRIIQTFLRAYPLKDSTGKNIGLVGAITDITGHKQSEELLRQQEQFLRTVFDGSEHAIFTLDFLEVGKLCYSSWNLATERGSGLHSADVIGKTPEDIFGAVAGKTLHQKYLSCLEAGAPITYEECLSLQGQETWWLTTLNPLKDSGGKIYRLVGTTIQITDRKLVEIQLQQQTKDLETALQELQQAQMQLVQNEKMSSLGQLVAGIAHEINNPVNFIYGNLAHANDYTEDLLELVQLYQQHYPNPILAIQKLAEEIDLEFLIQDLPQLLNSMKIGSQRIREIVISLRTFSRMDEAEKKEVDIHEGIDSTLMILEHRIKAKLDRQSIKVIKEYSSLPLVECYAGQLNQVFMNILANAIDALEESMIQKKTPENPQIHIQTQLIEPNQVTICIADNGPGISEEVQQKLFDPFFTTKPIGKGTGMGLSISYQIIAQKHSGSLKCISNLGVGSGTKFVITIPLKQN